MNNTTKGIKEGRERHYLVRKSDIQILDIFPREGMKKRRLKRRQLKGRKERNRREVEKKSLEK